MPIMRYDPVKSNHTYQELKTRVHKMDDKFNGFPRIRSVILQYYRTFKGLQANLLELEVIVGSNGSGKSSFFEFLKFLRDAMGAEIPPEIVSGAIGQQIFNQSGPGDRFLWRIEIEHLHPTVLFYNGEIAGPIGRIHVPLERVGQSSIPDAKPEDYFLYMDAGKGVFRERGMGKKASQDFPNMPKRNQLALSLMTNPTWPTLFNLREFIANWRFYNSFNINSAKVRRSVPVEQTPLLSEDGSNLSAVLFYLMSEHPLIFDELKTHLRSAVPGFRNLGVKARGGPGEVIAFWQEEGVDSELTLADLSDGILRFLCWTTLCLMPNLPALICIDEPDQGIHPRALPVLAGLFEKASVRTQILLATHASYFLTQFDLSRIAVMKKVNGKSYYLKPVDSETLKANLEDFGIAELEAMHRSDELEVLV